MSSTNDKNKLVWSDDPRDKARLAADAGQTHLPEASDAEIGELKWTAVFRLEKAKRGGKTVTVIDQLPRQENFVRDLCKELKSKCGSGGTYLLNEKNGVIEIQGDKRQELKIIFEKKKYRFKGM